MSIDVSKFRGSIPSGYLCQNIKISEGIWPENLSGHVFIVGPYHRKNDSHLFTGEGVIIKWDLKPEEGKIKIHSKKLKTWDSFWHFIHGKLLPKVFFPARLGFFGVAEIANTAIVNLDGRLILTADAGRYWEVEPNTLETITPIGYFDEHIVSVPVSFFPMVANTAHPFYDPQTKELITCELKSTPRQENLFTDMVSKAYITLWDGKCKDGKDKNQTGIRHWEVDGTVLDGSPHTTIVTEELVMIPDMPFQMGVTMLLGLKVPPRQAYPKTQIYVVNRKDLKPDKATVPSHLVTFDGDSYHFLCNYHHIDGTIGCVAIQQATISLTEAIQPGDVKHFSGDRYSEKYYGIPWMFGFDPGVLRKVVIKDAQLIGEEAFIHPGWFNTMLYTADPRELGDREGYSAIYQVYAGYHRDLICRRQYLRFRDHENRILTDKQLPQADLPSVLAKIPLNKNWQELTQQIKTEQEQNSDLPVSELGKDLLDFYVYPQGYVLDSIQFIPQDKGYIFTTVLTPKEEPDSIWLFAADNLKQGPIAKLDLPEDVQFGFTLHSDYFDRASLRVSSYNVNRWRSALRSLTRVPYEYIFKRPNDVLNRKVG
ncbi:MAG: carotenoid oxygenase family protein [Hydrococcus sp. Prado102]|jgi:carotenoid cleavage dioxygenase-like enzyme|nr:carotenoid oxygenase family protein [Hydrococcus sp. Prado102]